MHNLIRHPLFAAVGVAVGICGMQILRNITTNPEVRVTKEHRTAGILDNHAEGERYAENMLRRFVRGRSPQIMPNINSKFSDPN
ncbi:NADH-ubiquinone reductase complex 1 MLRQ subunit [Dillenia turbinata]|uniref:NADH-ubiquinone reductase complex 1 MLRQ subunit n=1 Tax=Dillenia turbinata TaxID=194707 RepID=A0AAN8Z0Y4_9MAGN